jgi:hypothetical protein
MKPGIQHVKRPLTWSLKFGRMIRRKQLEGWETKLSNCDVTPEAIRPIAKSLMNRDSPRAPSATHDSSGFKFLRRLIQRDCGLFRKYVHTTWTVWRTPWKAGGCLCSTTTWSRGKHPLRKSQFLWRKKANTPLKLRKASRIDGIQNECLRYPPRRPLL